MVLLLNELKFLYGQYSFIECSDSTRTIHVNSAFEKYSNYKYALTTHMFFALLQSIIQ